VTTVSATEAGVNELGFRYIRFHAFFTTCWNSARRERQDGLQLVGYSTGFMTTCWPAHQPFVELGFTPKALATSQNSIFYWNGNTSHPNRKVGAILSMPSSGIRSALRKGEVRTWYFEVWNEPNLSGFWEGGDQKAYFELYDDAEDDQVPSIPLCGSEGLLLLERPGSRVSGACEAEAAPVSIS